MIDVVIVNWNSGDQLKEAVDSLCSYSDSKIHSIIVVDNASTDDSFEFLSNYKTGAINLLTIANDVNNGFGYACNQGARLGRSKYILFFNPDARVFQSTLSTSIDFIENEKNKDVDVLGVQLVEADGSVARSCARFPTLGMFFLMALGLNRLSIFKSYNHHMQDWDHAETREVDHVIGAFFLIRRNIFERLNGFDEDFFVYLEDLDLSLRVRKLGGKIIYLASASAFHEGGGASKKVKANRLFYTLRSRIIYGFKHYNFFLAWALLLLTIFIEPVTRLAFSLLSGGMEDFRNTLKGYALLYKALPSIIKGQGR